MVTVPDSWRAVNDLLRAASESDCIAFLRAEKAGRSRRNVLLRIHARLNRVRAARERAELSK